MKTISKTLPIFVLPLLVAACGTTPTPVVGITPSLTGAAIISNLTIKTDSAGTVTSLSVQQTSTPPTLRAAIAAGSLGVTFTSVEVNIVDGAGITYTRTYKVGFGERVPSGWACKTASDASSVSLVTPLTDQCDANLKVPFSRTIDVAQLPILDNVTTTQVAIDFMNAYGTSFGCPDLYYNVTLNGYDDWFRPITPIVLKNQPINETCNVISGN